MGCVMMSVFQLVIVTLLVLMCVQVQCGGGISLAGVVQDLRFIPSSHVREFLTIH